MHGPGTLDALVELIIMSDRIRVKKDLSIYIYNTRSSFGFAALTKVNHDHRQKLIVRGYGANSCYQWLSSKFSSTTCITICP